MIDQQQPPAFYAKTGYRLFSAGLGVLLIVIGFYILSFDDLSMLLRGVTAAAFVLIGLNAVISAYKARESWLSRLGPFP